jgi:alpha-glucosidase
LGWLLAPASISSATRIELASASFSTPWLRLGGDHTLVNVGAQEQDESSLLLLYRKLITLRRIHPMLVSGEISSVVADKNLLRYERAGEDERLLVLLNLGNDSDQAKTEAGKVIAAIRSDREGEQVDALVELGNSEGLIIKLAR